MEIKPTPWPRLAPWLVLLLAAFAAGRWHGLATRNRNFASSGPEHQAIDQSGSRQQPFTSLAQMVSSPPTLALTDPRIAAFFEKLNADEVATTTAQLHSLPAGPQRDPLLLLAMRRWSEIAAPAALVHAETLENLPLRAEARAAIFEAWGRQDPPAACARAIAAATSADREPALTAALAGAAGTSAAEAVALWQSAPEAFRTSLAGDMALTRIAETAGNGGQRAVLQATVAGMPPGDERTRLTAVVARQWGRYEPEAAVAWLRSITSPGATQDGMIDAVFSAFVRTDPVRAATWATRQADERRRSNYVAAAVAEWAFYDSASAETWVNEQEDGIYLDGATSAIAAHFIEHRLWPQAFAWTRRILRNEARADLLGNLGHIWHAERPEEFSTFLAQTSLNRAELEMLRSKIVEAAAP